MQRMHGGQRVRRVRRAAAGADLHEGRELHGLVECRGALGREVEVAGAVEALARGVDVALEQLAGERAALDPHRPQQAGQGVVGDAGRHQQLLRVLAELGLGAVREGGAGQVGVHRREVLHADVRLVAPEPQPLEVAERHVAVAVLGLQAEADDVAEAHDALRRHHARIVR